MTAKGFVSYTNQQILWDRKDGIKFKTPSGKIELVSSLLENAGFPSFPTYEPVPRPEAERFRLILGRCAVHTHVSTQNNPYLSEIVPENVLWINSSRAAQLGISNGALVEVSSPQGAGSIRAFVTDHIHPERFSCSTVLATKLNWRRVAEQGAVGQRLVGQCFGQNRRQSSPA